MKVKVLMFAVAKQVAGTDTVEMELGGEATVADLRAALVSRFPDLVEASRRFTFAINAEYADEDAAIPANAEVACIPPVSGG